ncbi:MAG: hypothetical protein WCC18_10260 [Candidatus Acidiferrales bacterium]
MRRSFLDEEHLKLLAIGYWVAGGMAAFFSLFGMFYICMGAILAVSFAKFPVAAAEPNQQPPAFVGWFFVGIGLAIFLAAATLAVMRFWTAVSLKRRKSRIFCLVVAGLSCLEFPYGTTLGIFTFMVLSSPSVMQLFGVSGAVPPTVQAT